MQSSSRADPPEQALLERLRSLYVRLDDAKRHTSEYARLSAHIHQLSIVYCQLVDNQPTASGGTDLLTDPRLTDGLFLPGSEQTAPVRRTPR